MKIFAVLAILFLIGAAILGDVLWRRWIAKSRAERQNSFPPHERDR